MKKLLVLVLGLTMITSCKSSQRHCDAYGSTPTQSNNNLNIDHLNVDNEIKLK